MWDALWNGETTFRSLVFVPRFAAPFLTNNVSTRAVYVCCSVCVCMLLCMCMHCSVHVLQASRQSACGIVGRHMGAVSAVDMCIGPMGTGLALTGGMDGVLQLHFLEEP